MKKYAPCIISLIFAAYLVTAMSMTGRMADEALCIGMQIVVNDSVERQFVTARELARELDDLPARAPGMKLRNINTDSIERILASIDKIEDVNVMRLSCGRILVSVDPMEPIARVFDGKDSYYINRSGKRISADARYHFDAPIIRGNFTDSSFTPKQLLPLVDYIYGDSTWKALVSTIKVDSPTDVLIVPIVRGQVVNIGEPNNLESKFDRLRRFYREIMPVKGWDYYDTISVKWGGQIVATRRKKKLPESKFIREDEEEAIDINTMLAADGVAPGRSIPGAKARSEKPVKSATTTKKEKK